jgi:serine/threonine protein kinase
MGDCGREKPLPLQRMGPYALQRLLGRGAMASVYECRHTIHGRLGAIKVLHPHLARDRVAAARFMREGHSLSRIAHPNVVEIVDVGEHEVVPYLVDGDDLTDHMRRFHPMSLAQIADCMLPVISAVGAAHDA